MSWKVLRGSRRGWSHEAYRGVRGRLAHDAPRCRAAVFVIGGDGKIVDANVRFNGNARASNIDLGAGVARAVERDARGMLVVVPSGRGIRGGIPVVLPNRRAIRPHDP